MVDQRELFIDKYYTNIKVSTNYLDIYAVRTAIFESVKENVSKFKGLVRCRLWYYALQRICIKKFFR